MIEKLEDIELNNLSFEDFKKTREYRVAQREMKKESHYFKKDPKYIIPEKLSRRIEI